MYLRNCDLAVEGSPTTQTLMSPRRLMPSGVVLWTPPRSCSKRPSLIALWPEMCGATLSTILRMNWRSEFISEISSISSRVRCMARVSGSVSSSSRSFSEVKVERISAGRAPRPRKQSL